MSFTRSRKKISKDKEDLKDKIASLWTPLKKKEEEEGVGSGRVIWAFIGPAKTRKSMTAALSCYFNSDYAPMWKDKYPKANRLLKTGVVYEVTKVSVADTQGSFESRLMTVAKNREKFQQAIDDDRFNFLKINRKNPDTGKRDPARVIELIDGIIYEFEDHSPEDMLIIDSLSCQKADLDTQLHTKFGKHEASRRMDQKYYSWRNKNWMSVIKNLRDIKGSAICVYKTNQEFDDETRQYLHGKDHRYPVWVSSGGIKTAHWMDNSVMFDTVVKDDEIKCQVEFKTGEDFGVAFRPRDMKFYLKKGKFAYIQLMDQIADSLLAETD